MPRRFLISDRLRALLFGLTEGILIAALAVNVRDALREERVFRDIVRHAVGTDQPQLDEATMLALVHKTHRMIKPIEQGIADGSVEDVTGLAGYRRILFNSVASDTLFPTGKCGSYSGLLVKLLRSAGFSTRFVQMLDREEVTGEAHHIIVEALLDGRWVICDAMYDLVFRGEDGRILGFDEIKRDWGGVRAQCPADYDMRYDYRGARRVNFGSLNPWLQRTPLASWSPRVWLNEGAWLRVMLGVVLLALVVGVHVWFERSVARVSADVASVDRTESSITAPQRAPAAAARISPP